MPWPLIASVGCHSPTVLIHGPRQSGKTTLARTVGEARGYTYVSFDDADSLTLARSDPLGFVSRLPEKSIFDEVQKAPEIFSSLKLAIDRRRTPGRYILTGSANVLLVPGLSDSLAGRMEILQLHPVSQSEIERTTSRFLDDSGTFGPPPDAAWRRRLTERSCEHSPYY